MATNITTAKTCKYAFALLAGTLIMPLGAYLNGFPLIYPDSASYLQDGLRGTTELPRAMGYALFLSPFAALRVLWPVVFVQSAITLVFIEVFLRSVGLIRSRPSFVFFLTVLAWLTPLGWTVSWIMPDFAVPLVLLGIASIVVNVSARREIHPGFLCLIGLVAILHSSTIILLPVVSIMAAALGGVQFLIQKFDRTQLRRLLGVMGVLVIGSTAAGTAINAVALAHFSPLPPYTAPFLLARFAANGLLQDYLAAHCGESRFRICEYQNDLPRDSERFLWDEARPFTRLGAFRGYSREAAVLNTEIIQTYPVRVALSALNNAGQQLVLLDIRDGMRLAAASPYIVPMLRAMGFNLDAYFAAGQHREDFPGEIIVRAFYFIPLASLIIIAIIFCVRRARFPLVWAAAPIIVGGILINGFITGAGSGPSDRYNTRIVWLLPLLAIALTLGSKFKPTPLLLHTSTGEHDLFHSQSRWYKKSVRPPPL